MIENKARAREKEKIKITERDTETGDTKCSIPHVAPTTQPQSFRATPVQTPPSFGRHIVRSKL